MSTRELVFNYRTRGAKAAAKADEQVRKSVSRTGRAAQRNSGEVERWMARNKTAITAVATATAAGIASILALSPTLRAQFAGVRAGFTLFADTIVRDVLPAGRSLGSWVLDAVRWYRDLDDSIRRPISAAIAFAGILATVVTAFAAFAKVGIGVASVLAPVGSALLTVGSAIGTAIAAVAALISIKVVLIGVAIALATALIFNIGGARDKVIEFLTAMAVGFEDLLGRARELARERAAQARDAIVGRLGSARDRVLTILESIPVGVSQFLSRALRRARDLAAMLRDAVVTRMQNMRTRILALLDLSRQFAQAGRDWVDGMVAGVRSRADALMGQFRNMATQAANAFRNAFNRIIPSSVSIPRVSINIPDVLGGGSVGVGGGSIDIPQLDTGGRITGDGLAMVHAGEMVVPAAQVRDRGEQPISGGGTTVENVTIMVQSSGNPQRDGENIARAFERELSNRGAN